MFSHPRAYDMQRSPSLRRVERMTQCLAIDGHHQQVVGANLFGQKAVEPVKEAGLKCDRINPAEERSNAVSAGPFFLRQLEPSGQPAFLFIGPPRDRFRPFCSGDVGGNGDRNDVFNGVQNVDSARGSSSVAAMDFRS